MTTPEHRFHIMVVHRSTKSALFAALLFIASLFAAEVVNAGLIFDPADPALTGSTSVALDESIGLTPGLQNLQTVQNGVTYDFSTANSGGLYFDLDPDVALASYFPEGTEVLIEPPVEAIGFVIRYSTCTGTITFNGEFGSETFETPEAPVDLFIGAAGIGDIFSVTLNASCVVSLWSRMDFVPSSGGGEPPLSANLGIIKTGPVGAISQANSPVVYDMPVENLGPDTAIDARAADFLPPGTTVEDSAPPATLNGTGTIATMTFGDITAGTTSTASLHVGLPPFVPIPGLGRVFGCEDTLVNFALATSSSIESDPSDNTAITSNAFDKSSRSGQPEICDNGVDDDCDGLIDCGEAACDCLPQLGAVRGAQAPDRCTATFPPPAGCPVIDPEPRDRTDDCTDAHGNVVDPPFQWCCDFNLRPCLNPTESPPDCEERISQAQFNNQCGFPLDPNFKEAVPYVNAFGYGYTEAGRNMTYMLHYENVGDADAHDVSIVDVLDDDLDDTTLVVNDGGTYDAAKRTLLWKDPVVPPATPRSVSFSVDVRADAQPSTRVRNVGTIVFPDAVPPSRIDTNLVEHVITDPLYPVIENLKVFRCTETDTGSNEWQVDIVNEGFGFAYNVNATIIDPPAPVQVTDGMASFAHPEELIPPLPNTLTDNGDGTVTQVRDDPTYGDGSALMWLQDPELPVALGFDADGLMTFDEAIAWVDYLNTTDFDADEQLGYANHDDWRLPETLPVNGVAYNYNFSYNGSTDNSYNITSPNSEMAYLFYVELGNLGAFDTSGNAIPLDTRIPFNTGPFPFLPSAWSGTPLPIAADQAWLFDALGGRQFFVPKSATRYAWAVRDVPVPDPDAPTTVIPLAYTTSTDTVTFTTETPADPCGALTWRIQYERPVGTTFTVDVRDKPDADVDAVADAADNCPEDYNPTQEDSDGDGIGDACEEVEVVCVDDLQARPKSGKVQLTWTHTGADAYNVYRSTSSGGPYVLIANTTSTYSTYLDSNLVNGVTYYYVVREVALNTDELCQSNEASATPQARTRR